MKFGIVSSQELMPGAGISLLICFKPTPLPAPSRLVLGLKPRDYLCRKLGHMENQVLEQPHHHHCHRHPPARGSLATMSLSLSTRPSSMGTPDTNAHPTLHF